MSIVEKALKIAEEAHAGQTRKWGAQDPYIVHPRRCVAKAKELGYDEVEQAAMAVHDVLEDVAIPTNAVEYWSDRIRSECGEAVLERMWELTNPSDTKEWMDAHPNPRRAEKWAVNLAHIHSISDKAKRDKMIDRNDNCKTMGGAPYGMRRKYVPESWDLYNACRHTDEVLAAELAESIRAMEKTLK